MSFRLALRTSAAMIIVAASLAGCRTWQVEDRQDRFTSERVCVITKELILGARAVAAGFGFDGVAYGQELSLFAERRGGKVYAGVLKHNPAFLTASLPIGGPLLIRVDEHPAITLHPAKPTDDKLAFRPSITVPQNGAVPSTPEYEAMVARSQAMMEQAMDNMAGAMAAATSNRAQVEGSDARTLIRQFKNGKSVAFRFANSNDPDFTEVPLDGFAEASAECDL